MCPKLMVNMLLFVWSSLIFSLLHFFFRDRVSDDVTCTCRERVFVCVCMTVVLYDRHTQLCVLIQTWWLVTFGGPWLFFPPVSMWAAGERFQTGIKVWTFQTFKRARSESFELTSPNFWNPHCPKKMKEVEKYTFFQFPYYLCIAAQWEKKKHF